MERNDIQVCVEFLVGAQIGWEFEQSWSSGTTDEILDGTYEFILSLFLETEGDAKFKTLLARLFEFVFNTELSKFKLGLDMGFKYYYVSYRTCMYGSFVIQDFDLTLSMLFELMEFHKEIISSLWTIDNWAAPEATFFDEFELSSSNEKITLYSAAFEVGQETILYGTTNDNDVDPETGNKCTPLWWGKSDPNAAGYDYLGQSLNNLMFYVSEILPEHHAQTRKINL